MNRVLLTTFCLFTFAVASFAQASSYKDWSDYKPGVSDPNDWYVISGGSNFTRLIRPSSIKRTGEIVQYWLRTILDAGGVGLHQSKQEVNCRNSESRTVFLIRYREYEFKAGIGLVLTSQQPIQNSFDWSNDEFRPIVPESNVEVEMRLLCALR